MTTLRASSRFARAAALLSIPALAFAISISGANAREANAYRGSHGHGNGHGYGHGHAYGHNKVVYVAPRCHVRPVVATPVYYAPYRVYAPYPAYVPVPVVRPYVVAPLPYGGVVYDPVRGVNGYIGVAGPNFSIGVGF